MNNVFSKTTIIKMYSKNIHYTVNYYSVAL